VLLQADRRPKAILVSQRFEEGAMRPKNSVSSAQLATRRQLGLSRSEAVGCHCSVGGGHVSFGLASKKENGSGTRHAEYLHGSPHGMILADLVPY
jgi:hypothetical protein